MARGNIIDRQQVLESAERLVTERGAAALTFGAVAEAAGISKGGVQSAFGTKEALIAALLDRWISSDDEKFYSRLGDNPNATQKLLAHIDVTREADQDSLSRTASLMAALAQHPEQMQSVRDWYARRLPDFERTKQDAGQARIAFFATEGVFLLRYLGLIDMSAEEWATLFDQLAASLGSEAPPASAA